MKKPIIQTIEHSTLMPIPKIHQRGFTLIELLIGAVIGLFLIGGMAQIYLSTKQTYNITQGVGRIQEDTRFAYHFISRDLRETSNLGCLRTIRDMTPIVNNLNDLEIKIGGWDHNNTSPGDADIAVTNNYAVSTVRSNWQGLNNGANTQAPIDVQSIPNSDAFVIKKIAHLENASITPTGAPPPATTTELTINGYTPSANETLIVGNCQRADKFTVASISGNQVTPDNTASGAFLEDWDETSEIYRSSNVLYYLGLRASADSPSLFRKESTAAAAEELVEGVESMQVLYGLDTDADGTANRYVSARNVAQTAWVDVVSIRIGLLMVAINARERGAGNLAQSFIVGDGTTFVSNAGDSNLRYTTNITIKTRNLGLSENFSICRAGTGAPCDTLGFVQPTTP